MWHKTHFYMVWEVVKVVVFFRLRDFRSGLPVFDLFTHVLLGGSGAGVLLYLRTCTEIDARSPLRGILMVYCHEVYFQMLGTIPQCIMVILAHPSVKRTIVATKSSMYSNSSSWRLGNPTSTK